MPKSKKQSIYRMKGCSGLRSRKNKKYLGGSSRADLAYPSNNVPSVSNSNLAYTPPGSSGSSNTGILTSSSSNSPINVNKMNTNPSAGENIARAYPANGPKADGFNFLVSQSGGKPGHKKSCKCMFCGIRKKIPKRKSRRTQKKQKGGAAQTNGGLPYPNGLLGNAWTADVKGWPGIDGISMNRNHLGYNNYKVDPQTSMLSVSGDRPFSYMKGGKRRFSKKQKQKEMQKGGTMSNLFLQDIKNLGEVGKYNLVNTFNTFRGIDAPVQPLPWQDQFNNTSMEDYKPYEYVR